MLVPPGRNAFVFRGLAEEPLFDRYLTEDRSGSLHGYTMQGVSVLRTQFAGTAGQWVAATGRSRPVLPVATT